MAEILGDPEFGPCGEAIPPTNVPPEVLDHRSDHALRPLGHLAEGEEGSIELLLLPGETLEFLEANDIRSGCQIKVVGLGAEAVRIISTDGPELSLTIKMASRILVQKR